MKIPCKQKSYHLPKKTKRNFKALWYGPFPQFDVTFRGNIPYESSKITVWNIY